MGFGSLMELERMDGMDGPYPLGCTAIQQRNQIAAFRCFR